MTERISPEERESLLRDLARIVGVFGDDWQAWEDFGEISVRTGDSMPGFYTEVFRTSQHMGNEDDDRSPLADFLLRCPVIVPRLIAEVEHVHGEAVTLAEQVQNLTYQRDQARRWAVEFEQQLAKIKELAYMGGQSSEIVRRWIIEVFEAEQRAVDGEVSG